ncbi:MAG: response regulator [Candidatus Neomarinimicrobiota bacterium]|nr:MAG: response regulator [Candidatus Neomarinimicrobiota bacterium]
MSRQTHRILAVEDDRETLLLYQHTLGKTFTYFEAVSVSQALTILRRETIDLVVLDLSLKGPKDGLDLARTIRTTPEWKSIPIVAVTAHAFLEDRKNVLDAGCDDYVSKPVRIATLLDIIRKHLPE